MEKNYYEILEVDKKASQEIIEKAYKTLAKKYHPDLQNENKKEEYEAKMKLVNEAYSVLSDENQRKQYDEQLQVTTVPIEEYQNIVKENMDLRQEIDRLQNAEKIYTKTRNENNKYQEQQEVNYRVNQYNQQINNAVNQAVNQAYKDAYEQDLKNRGYKIKNRKTLKEHIKTIISIIILVVIILLIAQIPPIKKLLTRIYEENIVIKAIVDVFVRTFSTKFN